MPTPQQARQEQKREEKLRLMREQVSEGKLVIRQMTAAERKRFPAREPKPPRGRAKRA